MLQKEPKISVILPFYNAGVTLERAISSIANQTFIDFECILIDNNSTDRSWAIARSWVEKDQRFMLITEKQQGVVFASNAGSILAKGKYISRMDADDWAYPDKLKLQVDFLDSHPDFGAVAGLVKHVPHNENTAGFARFVEWSNSIQTFEEISNRRFIEQPIVNPTAMWRKEVAEKFGMYRHGDFPEDYELWLRWLGEGVEIHKLPDIVLKWYDSDTRLTRTQDIYSDNAFYRIKTKYLAEWLKKNNTFHPNVAIWGASRVSRRRAKLLTQSGINICCYIDTKKGRQLDHNVIYYEDIPPPQEIFVLSYIKQMDNRAQIRSFLNSKGYIEGENYLQVS
ncbi:MAG: glycosyltransferase family 2 protein [Bacteroidota bacterium]